MAVGISLGLFLSGFFGGGGGTPGGVDTQVQYNNSGAFGGISAITTDGVNMVVAATGYADVAQRGTPANPGAGTRRVFTDSGTGELSVRTSAGTTVSLEVAVDPSTFNLSGAYSTLPAAATAGRIFIPTDAFYTILHDTGAVWEHFILGNLLTLPINGDYSWINQGTATVTVNKGAIYLLALPAAGSNQKLRVKTAPSTPYTITGAFYANVGSANSLNSGLSFREMSSSKIIVFVNGGDTLTVARYTNATTLSLVSQFFPIQINTHSLVWLRIVDNGTTLFYSWSGDGQNFILIFSEARGSFFTTGPDQVGFNAESNNATFVSAINLVHWIEE